MINPVYVLTERSCYDNYTSVIGYFTDLDRQEELIRTALLNYAKAEDSTFSQIIQNGEIELVDGFLGYYPNEDSLDDVIFEVNLAEEI